ncbi:MAG: NAD(P)H-dependent oxidoreductase [Gemmatimonadetes bacterium]|nr:MAG: NAD(P)H-dependent oxidoreductase [Gemmatimonadota bacterium]
MNNLRILGIAGSLRQKSYNKMLLRAVQDVAPDHLLMNIFDLNDIPLYNGDVESEGDPPAVKHLKKAIDQADAVLFATPEYNYSIPGVLKNAIDWASRPPRPLHGKPAAIIGATMGQYGTVRAQNHLRQVLTASQNMMVMNKPEILIAKAQEKFDKDGNLIDGLTRDFLGKFMHHFAQWVERFK